MPQYKYQGRSAEGALVQGTLSAQTKAAIAEQLMQQNIIPISIVGGDRQRTGRARWAISARSQRVSTEEMVLFFNQLQALSRAGVPVVAALKQLAESTRSEGLKTCLLAMVEQMGAGLPLSTAMAEHPKVFSRLLASTVASGEETGQLDEIFANLADFLTFEAKAIKRIKSAIRYPSMVIAGVISAVVVMTTLVIPSYAQMFASLGAQLPLPTRMILAASNFMVQQGLLLLLGIVVGTLLLRRAIKTPAGRLRWHAVLLRAPVIGSILKRTLIARFARLLAMAYRAGLPLPRGLQQIQRALGNAVFEQGLGEMSQHLAAGENLTQAARNSGLFPPMVHQMLQVGEASGMLDHMLQQVAEFYEEQVDYDLARLDDLINPMLILILGVMVLIMALGVFLPMWELVRVSW